MKVLQRLAVSACALTLLGVGAAAGATAAYAAGPTGIQVGPDGTTADIYNYTNAITERVWIPVYDSSGIAVDQDGDNVADRVAIDIHRPAESGPTNKVPAIIDYSPYYTSVGRGNETQYIHTAPNGTADFYPLYYDNYFVPRGYAFIAAEAIGTGFSTGCPLHGGPGDVDGGRAVIDWLMGRIPGYTAATGGTVVMNDWDSGKNAMIGKSYDGTFANGVASTGVDGLTTIVDISSISSWYDYSRMGGIVLSAAGSHYPTSLDNSITTNVSPSILGVAPPNDNARCKPIYTPELNAEDGDATGDMNQFWQDRDYLANVSNVHAAVFETHGLNDDNVRPKNMAQWWAGLTANNVPRKLWLSQEGHVDPFDYRRSVWVDTLHRWFDYWLWGVQNGIMQQPQVDIERSSNVWETDPSWPLPGTTTQNVYLQGPTTAANGVMGLNANSGSTATQQFTDAWTSSTRGPSETTQISNPTAAQAGRLVYLSAPLTQPLHISGTPYVDLWASLNKTQSNIGATLVDYGPAPFSKVNAGSNEGVVNTTTRDCWGDSSPTDSACYLEVNEVLENVTQFRISRGILDSSNRDSLFTPSPVNVGQEYEFKFDIQPTDYVVPAGHRIGLILQGNYSGYGTTTGGNINTTFTVDTQKSNLQLPIVGGGISAEESGGFAPQTVDTSVGATVPSSLALSVGNATPAFGTFTPGVAQTYSTSVAATVTTTAQSSTLSASDGSTTFPGHLVNTSTGGPYSMVQGLQVDATSTNPAATGGGVFSDLSLHNPATILSYSQPVSNDAVTLGFQQGVGATDPLRTGSYAKTITYTLSTTTP